MWDLLNGRNEECEHLLDLLEDPSAATSRAQSVAELLEALPAAQRTHVAACQNCHDAVRDVVDGCDRSEGAGTVRGDQDLARRSAVCFAPGPCFVRAFAGGQYLGLREQVCYGGQATQCGSRGITL